MADKKKVVLVHIVPREPAGGVIDSRQIINNVLEGKLFNDKECVIITNDEEILSHIVNVDNHLEIQYIDTVPSFNEIHRLAPLILMALLKTVHANSIQAVFFLQEYPQILIPALFLLRIKLSGAKLIVKLHSMSYIKQYVKHTLKVINNIFMRMILIMISTMFSLLLKLADLIVVPNPYMAGELRRERYSAIYIPPGNLIDYASVSSAINKCRAKEPKYDLLFVSSKISGDDIILFIKSMGVLYQLYGNMNGSYGIVGKITRYDYVRVRKLLDIVTKVLGDKIIVSVSVEGLPRDKILCEISVSNRVITSGYLDTWNYMLFEALVAGKSVYYIAQNTLTYRMIESLIKTLGLDGIVGLGIYDDNKVILNSTLIADKGGGDQFWERHSELYLSSIERIV